jgi:hypothetical protein
MNTIVLQLKKPGSIELTSTVGSYIYVLFYYIRVIFSISSIRHIVRRRLGKSLLHAESVDARYFMKTAFDGP